MLRVDNGILIPFLGLVSNFGMIHNQPNSGKIGKIFIRTELKQHSVTNSHAEIKREALTLHLVLYQKHFFSWEN